MSRREFNRQVDRAMDLAEQGSFVGEDWDGIAGGLRDAGFDDEVISEVRNLLAWDAQAERAR